MAELRLPYEQILVLGNLPSKVFYKTTEWRKVRYHALLSHGNRCMLCGALSTNGPLEVDHIKPRVVFPELCLDPSNLQVLCNPCHTAKGMQQNDVRKKHTVEAQRMSDLLRVGTAALVLMQRPPSHSEVRSLFHAVRCPVKSRRSRWSLFVKYCANSKSDYRAAIALTVGEFMESPWCKNQHLTSKFLLWPTGIPKKEDDLFFDIDGHPFPKNMQELLTDGCKEIHRG